MNEVKELWTAFLKFDKTLCGKKFLRELFNNTSMLEILDVRNHYTIQDIHLTNTEDKLIGGSQIFVMMSFEELKKLQIIDFILTNFETHNSTNQ